MTLPAHFKVIVLEIISSVWLDVQVTLRSCVVVRFLERATYLPWPLVTRGSLRPLTSRMKLTSLSTEHQNTTWQRPPLVGKRVNPRVGFLRRSADKWEQYSKTSSVAPNCHLCIAVRLLVLRLTVSWMPVTLTLHSEYYLVGLVFSLSTDEVCAVVPGISCGHIMDCQVT